jgi:hypothetical protein
MRRKSMSKTRKFILVCALGASALYGKNPRLILRVSSIAKGTATLGTTAIASGTCATVVTVAATGVLTTDTINWSFNGDPTGVTGYTAATTGALAIMPYPTANAVNFKVCNRTSSSITPGAVTLNWRVAR